MILHSTPFSREELIPQEERLEIERKKGDLFIGIPKETCFQENVFAYLQMLFTP